MNFTNFNSYPSLWFSTNKTLNEILIDGCNFNYRIPLFLAGISSSLGIMKNQPGFLWLIFILVVGTGLFYLFWGYLFPWLLLKSGKIWNGKSNFKSMQKVFSLAQTPVIIILILQVLNLLFGQLKKPEEIAYIIQLISWIFFMRILITGISKVQEFTYGLTIVNIVIASLPILFLQLFFWKLRS